VKQAYFEWLLWAAEHSPAPPPECQLRVPAQEWLEAARGQPVAAIAKQPLALWLALSDLRRQRLFDEWFETAYETEPGEEDAS
jgi:hypothetical protein